MTKTTRTIHYSRLRYEQIPYKKGRVIRVWNKKHKSFLLELLSDIWRLFNWFKDLPGKKDALIGIVIMIGFMPHVEKVKADPLPTPQAPVYIKPVARLQPAVTISVPVPEEVTPVPEPQPVAPPPVAAPVGYPMGANTYRDYIFKVESGFNPASVNPGGCIGYGQDCNGWLITGRLNSVACPKWSTDIACQLQYWDWYANTIYGGWAQSYAFRSTHNYW